MIISIHVPSWGTTVAVYCNSWSKRFQSTFPRGERLYTDMQKLIMFNFNPRSLVGNDPVPFRSHSSFTYFNPRSLVGNDRSTRLTARHTGYFNPRSLVGNDNEQTAFLMRFCISIHVPSWGTTILEDFH